MRIVFAVCLITLCVTIAFAETDMASGLMRGTFKLEGPGSVGTAFVVGRSMKSEPKKAWRVLVTVAHVLEQIQGDKAVLHCRRKKGEKYESAPVTIQIRQGKKPLWTKHPKADVAVMYLPLPDDRDVYVIGTGTFISDTDIKKFEVHPGDTLFALGFPFGAEANAAGFPCTAPGSLDTSTHYAASARACSKRA